MNRLYPGQSNKSVASGVGIAIAGFPIFLFLTFRRVMIDQFSSTFSSSLKLQMSAKTSKYTCEEAVVGGDYCKAQTLLKGTINKRPGFSKPGFFKLMGIP